MKKNKTLKVYTDLSKSQGHEYTLTHQGTDNLIPISAWNRSSIFARERGKAMEQTGECRRKIHRCRSLMEETVSPT